MMPHFQSQSPTVMVTDAGRGSAIAIIRSLGRRGWQVIAADSDPDSPGFRSRYACERLLYPPPKLAPGAAAATLLDAVQDRLVDLLIPVTDDVILPLAAMREQFPSSCRLALPEPSMLAVVLDKSKTLELARRLGVPAPETRLVSTAGAALEAAPELGWPVVIKPQVSRRYRDQAAVESLAVSYAENSTDLVKRMRQLEGHCPALLQAYYPGVGCGVELLMHAGRPLAAFQHRRLREIPITGGASALRESVPLDPQLYDYAVRLLAALNWTGLAMVEFKVGSDGARLMEINGRVWGSLPLAVQCGVDFPGLLADLYLFGPARATRTSSGYPVGRRARNLELDLLWIAQVLLGPRRHAYLTQPSRLQGALALLELLHPAYKFDILSLADPGPGLAEFVKIARKFRHKLREARWTEAVKGGAFNHSTQVAIEVPEESR